MEAQEFGIFKNNNKLETNYERAIKELRKGCAKTQWMWFIFPQLKGLGWSEYVNKYGIRGANEAIAYYEHPVLRERLEGATKALLRNKGKSAEEILGEANAAKLCSCLTLFLWVDPNNKILLKALDRFYDGARDEAALEMLKGWLDLRQEIS